MNASSTDSRRVCAFRLSCFVFCEITASLPSCRPSGRSFCILVPDTPGPEFVGNSRERARRSPARGFQRLQAPLGGRSKADHAAGSFARQSAKADHVTRTSSRRSAKADCPARSSPRRSAKADCPARTSSRRSAKADRASRTSSRRSAKADCAARTSSRRSAKADRAARTSSRRSAKAGRAARSSPRRSAKADRGGRLCLGGAFPAARPAGTARFLITRGKASFYETATFGRRKVFFCSPFCGLLFCPTRAKLALPAGEKPAAPKPRPPRGGPAQRPRPAPGFCAASANARPGDSAPVRLLEKALWVPPTTEPFRPAPSGKPERKKERRNPG